MRPPLRCKKTNNLVSLLNIFPCSAFSVLLLFSINFLIFIFISCCWLLSFWQMGCLLFQLFLRCRLPRAVTASCFPNSRSVPYPHRPFEPFIQRICFPSRIAASTEKERDKENKLQLLVLLSASAAQRAVSTRFACSNIWISSLVQRLNFLPINFNGVLRVSARFGCLSA